MYLKARENWCVHFLPGWRIEGKLRVNEWKLFEKILNWLESWNFYAVSFFFVLLYVNSNDLQKSAGKRFEMHKNGIRKRSRIEKNWKILKNGTCRRDCEKKFMTKKFCDFEFFFASQFRILTKRQTETF